MTVTISRQDADDDVVDVTVAKLDLSLAAGSSAGEQLPLAKLLTDGNIEQTMDGAPGMDVTVTDAGLSLLNSGLFARTLDAELDSVPYRLVKVSLLDNEQLHLIFEHRVVAWLRQHDKYMKVSRGQSTRAEFIYKMVQEVQAGPIRFVSPDLHKKQSVAAPKKAKPTAQKKDERAPGFAPGAKVTVKGGTATAAQRQQMDRALTQAKADAAPALAVVAMMCAGTGESDWIPRPPNRLGYRGVFQWAFDQYDTESQAHFFLAGGKGFQRGGATKLARANPSMDPGAIATAVEASGEAPAFYGKWKAEAIANIKAWNGGHSIGSGSDSGATGDKYWEKVEFARGQPDQKEDSWTAGLRLASEVRWRLFVTGRRSLWYVTDDYLFQSKPRYLIDPTTKGVERVNFDVECGGRTIIVSGKRVKKPSEATLTVHMDRWDAPAGSTIELADYGPADGRWLVGDVKRGLFDSVGTVTIRQPQKELQEPRGQQKTRTSSSAQASRALGSASAGRGSPGAIGKVKVLPGANRPGVGLHKPLLVFLGLVAGQTREAIEIATGTNHNQFVLGTHNQSDHWTGDASDLNVGGDARRDGKAGAKGDNIATAALVVLGVPRSQARQFAINGKLDFGEASNYTWNGCHVQVGWRTMVGGNHWDHVHIGVKPPAQLGKGALDEIAALATAIENGAAG